MTPSNILDITQNQNAASTIGLVNGNGGASAQARVLLGGNAYFTYYGTGFTTSGVNRAGGAKLGNDDVGGLTITTGAAQPIYFGINNTEVARFDTTGALTVATSTVYNAAKISTSGKIAALGSFGNTKFTEQTGAGAITLATLTYPNASQGGCVKVKVFTNGTSASNGGYAYEYSEWVVTYSSYGGVFQSPVITRNVQNQYSINGGVISCTTTITATGTGGTLTITATPSSGGTAPYTAFRTDAQLELISPDYGATLT
jgi:hypothetical protein